jgi:hypothetical protein
VSEATTPKFEFDLFVSYARENQEQVLPVVRRLEAKGLRVFGDWLLRPGDIWEMRLDDALPSCVAVAVMVTRESVQSTEVQIEIYKATSARRDIAVIPVLLDGTNPSGTLHSLKVRNRVDLASDDALRDIVDRVVRDRDNPSTSELDGEERIGGIPATPIDPTAHPSRGSLPAVRPVPIAGPWVAISVNQVEELIEALGSSLALRSLHSTTKTPGRTRALDLGAETSGLALTPDGTAGVVLTGPIATVFAVTVGGEIHPWPKPADLGSEDRTLLAVRRCGDGIQLLLSNDQSVITQLIDHRGAASKPTHVAGNARAAAAADNGFALLDDDGTLAGGLGFAAPVGMPATALLDVDIALGSATALCAVISDRGTVLHVARQDSAGSVSLRSGALPGVANRVRVVRPLENEAPTTVAVEIGGSVSTWAWDDLPDDSE